MDELLKILRRNARETHADIAKMLGTSAREVTRRIAAYEKQGVIRAYQTVLNEDLLDLDRVHAAIEIKVTPERDGGFDRIARRISRFPEVQNVYLMSGAYDLLLFVEGKDLREIAEFVSRKLATIGGILSCSTHFMLKNYKRAGVLMDGQDEGERLQVTP